MSYINFRDAYHRWNTVENHSDVERDFSFIAEMYAWDLSDQPLSKPSQLMVTENRQNRDQFQAYISVSSTLDVYVINSGTLCLLVSEFGHKSHYIDQIRHY